METIRYRVHREITDMEADSAVTKDEQVRRLVERATGGDVDAFGELYGIYLDPIYRYIYYQIGDKTTAEDLAEEIFLKAWRGIGKFKWKGQPFSSWLYRIAHNHIVDYFRTNRQTQLLDGEIPANDGDPVEEAEGKMIRQELLDAIAFLPRQQQQIIILKFIEGLENVEIAKIIGKSQGAIRVMQMRALTTLRQRLNGEVQYEG